jgi:hypothetical protein
VPAERGTRLGYHELTDVWAERLVAGAGVRPGDLVLDIGAGNGAITAPLVATGARGLEEGLPPYSRTRRKALCVLIGRGSEVT